MEKIAFFKLLKCVYGKKKTFLTDLFIGYVNLVFLSLMWYLLSKKSFFLFFRIIDYVHSYCLFYGKYQYGRYCGYKPYEI